MSKSEEHRTSWATIQVKNAVRLGYWTGGWVLSIAMLAFGPRYIWEYATLPTILVLLVNLGIGYGMIAANRQYLIGLDELHKKVFLDAGAFTLGAGLVGGSSYELLEGIRLITFEPEISHLMMLMCLVFLASLIRGLRKYQ